jgi:catechol 2,3-dioxygenase-like lactoylglutathione lyase family enzyme
MLWYLGYVVLYIDDFAGAIDFYTNKVGLPLRLKADGYAEFAVEGAKFAIMTRARVAELAGAEHAVRPIGNCPDAVSNSSVRPRIGHGASGRSSSVTPRGTSSRSGPIFPGRNAWGYRRTFDPD